MPELAEVEYFRKTWDAGVGRKVLAVHLHAEKRLFRGTDTKALQQALTGAKLLASEARGKQLAFRFSGGAWLGLHLGMTGHLNADQPDHEAEKHEHLVLAQRERTLVFRDARMFGRVLFHQGKEPPEWWSKLPPALSSEAFTLAHLRAVLQRRRRSPLKGVLLVQELFPGVGNWMADEILWQSGLNPKKSAGELTAAQERKLWTKTRAIVEISMKTIGVDWGDPPKGWLIHVRWKRTGKCPKHGTPLTRETVAGRTTAWCPKCQPVS